jgi:chorismate synthase
MRAPIIAAIDECKKRGDTLGGIVEVVTTGLPPGLGSHVHWDRKLDGRLAHALMSIQAVKGVEIGLGFETARRPGSAVHDEIYFDEGKREFVRRTNMAGGTEGGMTSGLRWWVVLPLATLMKPLHWSTSRPRPRPRAQSSARRLRIRPAVIAEAVVAF